MLMTFIALRPIAEGFLLLGGTEVYKPETRAYVAGCLLLWELHKTRSHKITPYTAYVIK